MRSIRMLGLALVATMAVAGCGSDDDDPFGPGNMGNFDGNITGDVTATLNGNAAFSVYDDGGTDVFELILTSGSAVEPTHVLTFVREGGRPANGTYDDFTGAIFIDSGSDTYVFDGGSVTITSSGTGGVNGSINITATDGTNDITITGTFQAECLEDEEEGLSCG